MNIFTEKNKKKWYGMYRAQIVEINDDIKNGIYKVRVYPMMADIEDDYLPLALSNMTNVNNNENFVKDEFIWVFFENGNPKFPIIFDRCNIKDQFPAGIDGEEPDWFGDIEYNADIEEDEVTYEGEYGTVWAKNFGENIHLLFDYDNELLVVKGSNFWIVIDSDGNYHKKVNSTWITCDEKFNVAADTMLMMIGDNKIEASDEGVIINDNLKVLNT